MNGKLESLKKLRDQLNITVNGIENYPTTGPSLIMANHNALIDIFYLPCALPEPTISLVSSRVVYKPILDRQRIVNHYLYPMPIEACGGGSYANICLELAVSFLEQGISISIFPEGGYGTKTTVYRGKTGLARILFQSRMRGIIPNLVPVAIDLQSDCFDYDSYIPNPKDRVSISILNPINYDKEFDQFINSVNDKIKNQILHVVVDKGMEAIAHALGKNFSLEYCPLKVKNSIIWMNGQIIPKVEAQNRDYIDTYYHHLNEYSQKLIKQFQLTYRPAPRF